jgi:hypothetical protein
MSRKRQLVLRREDANVVVGIDSRRHDERRFREIRPHGDPLHRLVVETRGVENNRHRVAEERTRREHVDLLEAERRHRHTLPASRQRLSSGQSAVQTLRSFRGFSPGANA